MTRDQFLHEIWTPYPTLPENAVAYGRLLRLDGLTKRAQLWREDQIQEVELKSWALPVKSVATFNGILILGDLLAVGPAGEVTLMTPCRAPGSFQEFPKTLKSWNHFLRALRKFFETRGFSEVITPSLVVCPGTEPSLDPFSTEWKRGSKKERLYLPTSPELHLKKSLARGLEKIFEIKTCYRNDEWTQQHRPEFLMLEWYRAWEKPDALKKDLLDLFQFLTAELQSMPAIPQFRQTTMAELFKKHLDEDITVKSNRTEYLRMVERLQLRVPPDSTIDDLFFLIFTEKIEPNFNPDEVTLVQDWPPFQAALARLTKEGWADRFEIYWKGLELANAFHELNDPDIQRKRFSEDLQKKKKAGKEEIPLDDKFLMALDSGMPPSVGIALGVERLFMAFHGLQNLSDIRFFEV